MITSEQAEKTVRQAFENHGATISSYRSEPFMGGHLADVSSDGVPTGRDPGTAALEIERKPTQIREGRQWEAVLGRMAVGGLMLFLQGECGTYGEHVETEDVCNLKIWIGEGVVPKDVEHGFRLEHETDVARAAVIAFKAAADALASLSDEAVIRAGGTWATPDVREQVLRLEGSPQA